MSEVSVPTPTPTGVEAVDRVLDLVAGLDQQPLGEHAAVFEEAHRGLRSALDNPAAAVSPTD